MTNATNAMKFLSKGTLAVQQYQSQIRVFLNLCLHQQLKFDNSLYLIHTKWFVLIAEFLVGCHLEMWCSCITVPDPHSFPAIVFLSRVENGTAMQTHISTWWPTGNSVIKTTLLAWITYRELPNLSCWQCRHKLKKTLIRDWYCWTDDVPFNTLGENKTSSNHWHSLW